MLVRCDISLLRRADLSEEYRDCMRLLCFLEVIRACDFSRATGPANIWYESYFVSNADEGVALSRRKYHFILESNHLFLQLIIARRVGELHMIVL